MNCLVTYCSGQWLAASRLVNSIIIISIIDIYLQHWSDDKQLTDLNFFQMAVLSKFRYRNQCRRLSYIKMKMIGKIVCYVPFVGMI